MKILIVSTCPTHPVTAGNRKGILNQVEILRNLGNEVYFFYIHISPLRISKDQGGNLNELRNYWGDSLFIWKMTRMIHLYQMLLQKFRRIFNNSYLKVDDLYPQAITKKINQLNSAYQFDCCIVNYYFLSKLFTKSQFPIKALFTHDYFAYKNLLVGMNNIGYNTTAHEEAKALQRSPNILSVNSDESVYFSKLSPQSNIYNIFSHYTYHPLKYVGNKKILFFSGNNIFNINGIKWFIDNIYPHLKKDDPNIELVIGGSICNSININCNGISLYGLVDNPETFYSIGDIVINPTSEGTGLKIKTFEAISYNRVVIAHPHSVEGIYKPEVAPVLVAKNDLEWIDYIKNTIQNEMVINKQMSINRRYLDEMNSYVELEYKKLLGI